MGTTNRTYVSDYQKHLKWETGLVLSMHTSNYRVVGFTHRPEIGELAKIAKECGVPVLEDIGSGLLVPSTGDLASEPMRARPWSRVWIWCALAATSCLAALKQVFCWGEKISWNVVAAILFFGHFARTGWHSPHLGRRSACIERRRKMFRCSQRFRLLRHIALRGRAP